MTFLERVLRRKNRVSLGSKNSKLYTVNIYIVNVYHSQQNNVQAITIKMFLRVKRIREQIFKNVVNLDMSVWVIVRVCVT